MEFSKTISKRGKLKMCVLFCSEIAYVFVIFSKSTHFPDFDYYTGRPNMHAQRKVTDSLYQNRTN